MKRLSQLLATVAVAILVPLAISVPASAAFTCDVGYTGPNSQNMCTSEETYQCEVTNINEVEITNETGQSGYSGSVDVEANTSGGNAASGSVTNENGTVFTVTITNSVPDTEYFGTCTAVAVVPAVETPETVTPVTPVSTGGGAVQVLPVTGNDTTIFVATIVAGVTALVAVLTAIMVIAYRRFRTE